MLPVIVIDVSPLYGFLHQPLHVQLWTVFAYVGWIPFVWIIGKGLMEMWLLSRQANYARTLDFVLLAVNVQAMNEQSPKAVEHIFAHIAGTYSSPNFKEKWIEGKFTPPFSFEYAVKDGYTQFIIGAPTKHRDLVEAAVFSQYPDAEIAEIEDYTHDVPKKYPDPEWDVWGAEYVLKKPSPYPIRTWFEFEHSLSQELKDPLSTLLESFSKLKKGERLWMQIIVYPIDQGWMEEGKKVVAKLVGREVKEEAPKWAKPIHGALELAEGAVGTVMDHVLGGEGDAAPKKDEKKKSFDDLTPGEQRTVESIETKISKIGLGVKIRFVYAAKRGVFRKGSIISMIKGAMGLFTRHDGNAFTTYSKVVPKSDYFWQRWSTAQKQSAIVRNYVNRSGNGATPFILNIEELASIYHFPSMLVKAPLIKKVESRKVEPPFRLPTASEPEPKLPEAK